MLTALEVSYTNLTVMEPTTETTTMLAPEFLTAGRAVFTADNGKGQHYTFKISQPPEDPLKPLAKRPFFVKLLTGPDNGADYTYMGMLVGDAGRKTLEFVTTPKSNYPLNSVPVRVIQFALRVLQGKQELPDGYHIRHEGKCGMCGRTLTEPESLECGIGPVCREKMGI